MDGPDFRKEAVIQHFVSRRAEHPEESAEQSAKVALAEVKELYDVVQSEFNF